MKKRRRFCRGVFVYQAITSIMPNNYSYNFINFGINPDSDDCMIDNIKLERGVQELIILIIVNQV